MVQPHPIWHTGSTLGAIPPSMWPLLGEGTCGKTSWLMGTSPLLQGETPCPERHSGGIGLMPRCPHHQHCPPVGNLLPDENVYRPLSFYFPKWVSKNIPAYNLDPGLALLSKAREMHIGAAWRSFRQSLRGRSEGGGGMLVITALDPTKPAISPQGATIWKVSLKTPFL